MILFFFLFLFLFWVTLSGSFSLDVIMIGVVLSLLVTIFTNKYVLNFKKLNYWGSIRILFRYLITLLVEVWKANMDMIKIVLFSDPDDKNPSFAKFNSHLSTHFGKTALAHAITLTPGTITIGINEDTFYVTSMDLDMLDAIDDSVFISILQEFESINE